MSAEELQRQIEAIQQQIAAQAGAAHQAPSAQPEEEEEYEEYEEEEVEEYEDHEESAPARTVSSESQTPSWKLKQQEREAEKAAAKAREEEERKERSMAAAAANASQKPPGHDEYAQHMEQLKKQHEWEKPIWAAPTDDIPPDQSIISDPINNPFLKPAQHGGYQRQVKEKDLEIIKGTFVSPEKTKKLEPRLTWIVVNINKRKVGKIVMHLYGKDVNGIVDQFLELKGLEIERQNGMLVVPGINPTMHVTSAGTAGLDSKSGVFGVIQEGRNIFDAIMNAPPDAILSIKQAHIYPVKKGSSGL